MDAAPRYWFSSQCFVERRVHHFDLLQGDILRENKCAVELAFTVGIRYATQRIELRVLAIVSAVLQVPHQERGWLQPSRRPFDVRKALGSRLSALVILGILVVFCARHASAQQGGPGYVGTWGDPGIQAPQLLFKSLAAGNFFTVGITSPDGYIRVWGSNGAVTGYPGTLGGFTAVAAGWDHAIALHADGFLVAWSTSVFESQFLMGIVPNDPHYEVGQTPIYTAIAAGEWFNLALRSDGTIWAWGDNSHHVVDINDSISHPDNVPGAFTAIAAGGHHGVARRSNGKIKVWGGTGYSANSCTDSPHPGNAIPAALANAQFVGIGAGHSVTYGILADGQRTVIGWGCDCAVHDPSATWVGNVGHADGFYVFGAGAAVATGGYQHGFQLQAKNGGIGAWGDPAHGCNVAYTGNPPNVVPASYQGLNVLSIGVNNVGKHNAFIYEPPAN